MSEPTPSLATPYRTHTCGRSCAPPTPAARHACRAGSTGGATRASSSSWTSATATASPRSSSTRPTPRAPTRSRAGSAPSSWSRVAGEVAQRLAGTENAEAADRRDRAPRDRRRDPDRGEDAAVPHQRPDAPVDETLRLKYRYLDIRREPMAASPAAALPAWSRRSARSTTRNGFVEVETPDAHQEHARGRPRLHRPEPAPAGQRLRPAAEPAAAQAAADGRRRRPLLPDRALLPRRGPARRPPARVHPARPRDELRRRGDRHGLRRGDGDRGRARATAPERPIQEVAVPALHLRRGHGAVRLRQAGRAVRDGARRPRAGAGRRRTGRRRPVPRVRRRARRRAAGSRRSSRPAWPARPGARSTS